MDALCIPRLRRFPKSDTCSFSWDVYIAIMAECVDITAGRPTLLSAGLFKNFVGNNPTAGQSKNKYDVRIYSSPYRA